ncbi:MAG: GTPase [Cyanobacteria bacterium P01_F01_bin.150]
MGGSTRQSGEQLARWQWAVLALPIVSIVGFVMVAAGVQIHAWGISWIWAIMTLIFVGWRWLAVKWTQPLLQQLSGAIVDLQTELDTTLADRSELELDAEIIKQADIAIRKILDNSQDDGPIWEDWPTFWQRCQEVVSAIAHLYHPDVKYPLLNIHIPQAYGLIRGTVDDMDLWMQKLSPILNQVSVGQAYRAYEVYRKIEPSARKLGKVWSWARWLWNPAAAAAQTMSQPYNNQATQQLLVNLSQSLREVALHTLGQQAIALYSGKSPNPPGTLNLSNNVPETLRPLNDISNEPLIATPSTGSSTGSYTGSSKSSSSSTSVQTVPSKSVRQVTSSQTSNTPSPSIVKPLPHTQTIQTILDQANPAEQVNQDPVKVLLVGRTGAGKSSVINTLFQAETATVDVLPSTDQIHAYQWPSEHNAASLQPSEEAQLILWDSPGYEQTDQTAFREQVLNQAQAADVIILVTPVMDPALQMDVDFLTDLKREAPDLPVFVVVTQIDRVRPVREWNPPYDWQQGTRAKEQTIRDAIAYRQSILDAVCDQVLPLVTLEVGLDGHIKRLPWNDEILVERVINAIAPAKQLRLARFLKNQELQAHAAAKIIHSYTIQMTTAQGIASFLKSPVLKFMSTLTTGSPDLAYLLEEQIPVEQLPLVTGKLQMAYDLHNALSTEADAAFNLLSLWPLLLDCAGSPRENAALFGHVLVEHFIQQTSTETLHHRFYKQIDQLSN